MFLSTRLQGCQDEPKVSIRMIVGIRFDEEIAIEQRFLRLGDVEASTPGTVITCALVLGVRNWLWHLTMNRGELKKCERHHFTDWHWAQFEQAGLLPGPVEIPSNTNYWLYTTASPGKKSGAFEFRRNLFGVGQIRLSWACFCMEQEAEYLTWKQAIEASNQHSYLQLQFVLDSSGN